MLLAQRNLLDVFRFQNQYLGIYPQAFDQVSMISGMQVQPVEDSQVVWDFRFPRLGKRGRLLDTVGLLEDDEIQLSTQAVAYMITRQSYTLALLMPGTPQQYKLAVDAIKPLNLDQLHLPSHWPEDIFSQAMRFHMRKIALLDEQKLLTQIGLRTNRR